MLCGKRVTMIMVVMSIVLLTLSARVSATEKEWTILIHMCGDSHNEKLCIDDINAFERGFDPDKNYNVVVQVDRIDDGAEDTDASNGNWTTARRYLIQRDTNSDRVIRSTLLEDIGEVNVGDPQTISDFITWGYQNYPAKRLAVFLWGGANSNGFGADKTSGNDAIRTLYGELTDALSQSTAAIGRRIDFCVIWGCNYGMIENDFVIREYADVTARSQIPTPNAGNGGTDILEWLNVNSTTNAQDFATALVDKHIDNMISTGSCSGWAAFDLGPGHVRLSLAVDTFGRELIKEGGIDQADIATAITDAEIPGGVDLCFFAKNITNTTSLSQDLRNAAQAVLDAYGYPPQQTGKPLLNFRFNEGSRSPNESYPDPEKCDELRGAKIRTAGYDTAPLSDPPDVTGKPRYAPWVANNTWKWFLEGETSLPAESLLTYDSNSLGDTIVADGSPFDFSVTIRNSGGASATGISGTIWTTDPYVTITQDTSTFPDIFSEDTGTAQTNFSITIDPIVPDGHRVWFWLDITANGGTYTNTTSFCVNVNTPPDTEAPSVPQDLIANAVSGNQIDLTWSASTDNIAVTGYKIFRDGIEIGTTTETTYSSTGLLPETTYTYEVSAYDAAGNESAKSYLAYATTLAQTSVTLTTEADATIIMSDTNLGATTVLAAYKEGERCALLRFDLTGIDTSTLTSATLRLYRINEGDNILEVSQYTDDWDEMTVTGNNAPTPGESITSAPLAALDTWQELTVTDYVKTQTDGKISFHLDEQELNSVKAFYSSREGGNPPELVLELNGGPENQAPTAVISADVTEGDAPLAINFDAGGSSDPDGSIVSYDWDFGNGDTDSGATVSYTYTSAGTYTATLTVTDDQGATGTDTIGITVTETSNQVPTAVVSTDVTEGDAPLAINFDAGGSSDSDGSIVSYDWDFGNGDTDNGATVSYTYTSAGTYTATLTVTDDQGATGTDTIGITVTDSGLVGYWKLDEVSGSRADNSGLDNTLADNGGVGSDTGKDGNAANLSGSNYLTIEDAAQNGLDISSALTLAAWIKPAATDGYRMIMSKYDMGNSQRSYRMENIDGKLECVLSSTGSDYEWLTGTTTMSVGEWHHVAMVFDGSTKTVTLYINGEVDNQGTVSFSALHNSTAPFAIGMNYSNGSPLQFFEGLVDEARVYAKALSQTEIQALMDVP